MSAKPHHFRTALLLVAAVVAGTTWAGSEPTEQRPYNGPYDGPFLNRVAFPIGGIGAGMICLEGTGAFSHVSVRNTPEVYNEPHVYAALCIKGNPNVAKVL